MSELKCCKICGAFLTCDRKGECCPECQYFDEADMLCLAPDALKKKIKKTKPPEAEEIDIEEEDDVDPETFLFEDDEEEEEEDLIADDEDDDFDDEDDFDVEDVEW